MFNADEGRYKVILDNLLEITPNDATVFTTINNKYFFDFYKFFGKNAFSFIYGSKGFKFPLLEVNLLQLLSQMETAQTYEEVLHLLHENDQDISDGAKVQLRNNFEATKSKIIEKIRVDFQKSTLKWKLLLNRAREINDEINIWPLHLGFLYVSLVIDDKTFYAPMFFKEVVIEFENGRPFLLSNGDIKVNEKLIFILNNAGFNIHFDFDYSTKSISELVHYLAKIWGQTFKIPQSIQGPFQRFRSEDIKNLTLNFHPGITLGIFLPSGGYARNRMKEIIEKNEIDNIFDIEFNKNIYKYRIKNTIFDPSVGLFKITPTNYSQDKAIVSALGQNTIIWGPPGTGKSQTIVNLLANILVYGKTGIVASQKKAALEVIRKRMSDLRMFCLFILTSKDMRKKSFYKPIKEYLNFLEYFEESYSIKPIKVIRDDERRWVDKVAEIAENPKYSEILEAYFYLYNNLDKLTNDDIDYILTLPANIIYPYTPINNNIYKSIMRANRVNLWHYFKNYKNLRTIALQIERNLNDFKGSLAELVIKFRNLDPSDIAWLREFLELLPEMESDEKTDIQIIKNIVGERVFNKVNNFSPEKRKLYSEFAASVRIGNLEPYKFIKRYSSLIKELFPIIIATPDTDLSAWHKEEFDYAIMDESSQIFIEKGLPILYLAKTKVLAGDEKQMKPSNWFRVRTTDDSIFGNVESLLDYAHSLGVYSILLDKNYRSNHAALMTFSSKYFYESSLDVIDSAHKANSEAIEVIEVNGAWEDNRNVVEAEVAIDIVDLNLNKYKKIILLAFNAKQCDYITNLIYQNYSHLEEALEEGRLMIRNIENIQGDEADLVVATIAYDKNSKIHSTYVGRPGGMNALNVAISRAKDKMVVIKTIKSSDINNYHNSADTKLFREWLLFLEKTNNERRELLKTSVNRYKPKAPLKINSNLVAEVKSVIGEIIKPYMNVKMVENYPVGTIYIDLVVLVDNKPYKCFLFDNFSYANDYEAYVLFKDYFKFLKSKHYDTKILNDVIWLRDKKTILDWFSASQIQEFSGVEFAAQSEEPEDLFEKEEFLEDVEVKDSETLTKEWKIFLDDQDKEAELAKEKAKTQAKATKKTTTTSTNNKKKSSTNSKSKNSSSNKSKTTNKKQ
ncbi:endonuclease [Mycoplasmopsis pullorum]|uniref:DEAD/DEAH box helicase n=1 Tax=Mycoplasmopsis pullorum TaxID=48003 RepID=UPI001118D6A6|nr:DEAD/DEAH box helicase [Mycoplasmopsis pullorum]TNK83897.1 endonuclease [Mycoplasmopsis pullorum]TNK92163.1 endonuclease [Mycoplasmopsis pullorum]